MTGVQTCALPILDVLDVDAGGRIPTDRRLGDAARLVGRVVQHLDLEQLARSALAYGSLLPAAIAGAAVGLVNRSQREAINMAGALWGDLTTSLAGVDLRVEGEEHLWSHRPAVFIFNHQSGLDAPLMLKMVRRDVTGVGKKELPNCTSCQLWGSNTALGRTINP